MGTVTVSPAPRGTFGHTPLSPTAAQIVQPDAACGGGDEETERLGEVDIGSERDVGESKHGGLTLGHNDTIFLVR